MGPSTYLNQECRHILNVRTDTNTAFGLVPPVPLVAGGPLPDSLPAPAWTQGEAISYECACECISHLRAIYTFELCHGTPSPERRAALELE